MKVLPWVKLGLILLSQRCWYNKLILFYKIANGLPPDHLQSYIEVPSQENYPLRSVSAGKLKLLPSPSKSFKKALLPYYIDERNKLNPKVKNTKSINK